MSIVAIACLDDSFDIMNEYAAIKYLLLVNLLCPNDTKKLGSDLQAGEEVKNKMMKRKLERDSVWIETHEAKNDKP